MTMADNLRFSRHKEIKGKINYAKYDNYNAIEVPFTDAIPSDYKGRWDFLSASLTNTILVNLKL